MGEEIEYIVIKQNMEVQWELEWVIKWEGGQKRWVTEGVQEVTDNKKGHRKLSKIYTHMKEIALV